MTQLQLLRSVIPREFIATMLQRVETTLRSIHQDYYAEISYERFHQLYVTQNFPYVMQLATLRFADFTLMTQLRNLVTAHIWKGLTERDVFLHPSFFLRLTFPSEMTHTQSFTFLNTEPHYDSYEKEGFEINSSTIWLPFEPINEESGGLCTFNTPEIFDHFINEGRTSYPPGNYFKIASEVDPLLLQSTVTPEVEVGDILAFHSQTLHGATRPKKRRRISFDFRLLPRKRLTNAPVGVRHLFEQINNEFDHYLAEQLIELKDFIGAEKLLKV